MNRVESFRNAVQANLVKQAATLDKGPRDFFPEQLKEQLAFWDVAAISGGRIETHGNGFRLPVAYGYAVDIFLEADDTYTVQTVFTRSGVTKVVNSSEGVYADEVSQAAYQASLFRDKPWEKGGSRTAYNDVDIEMAELGESADAASRTLKNAPFDPALHGKYVEDATLGAMWGMTSIFDAVTDAAAEYGFAADDAAHNHSFEYAQGKGKRDIERMERGGSRKIAYYSRDLPDIEGLEKQPEVGGLVRYSGPNYWITVYRNEAVIYSAASGGILSAQLHDGTPADIGATVTALNEVAKEMVGFFASKTALSGIWEWEEGQGWYYAYGPGLAPRGRDQATVRPMENGRWDWVVWGTYGSSVADGEAATLEEAKAAAELAGIPFPGQQSIPFDRAAGRKQGLSKSDICPNCGSWMDNVFISAEGVLRAVCDNCGWRGTKRMGSAKTAGWSKGDGYEWNYIVGGQYVGWVDKDAVTGYWAASVGGRSLGASYYVAEAKEKVEAAVAERMMSESRKVGVPIGDWNLDEHVQIIDATPRSRNDPETWKRVPSHSGYPADHPWSPDWRICPECGLEIQFTIEDREEVRYDHAVGCSRKADRLGARKVAYDPELAQLGDMFQHQFEDMKGKERADTLPCPEHKDKEATHEGTYASFPSSYSEYRCPEGHDFKVRVGTTREDILAEGKKTALGESWDEGYRDGVTDSRSGVSARTEFSDKSMNYEVGYESGYREDQANISLLPGESRIGDELVQGSKKTGFLTALQRGVRRVLALDPQSGYGDSSLPTVEDDTPDDDPMWPWEIGEIVEEVVEEVTEKESSLTHVWAYNGLDPFNACEICGQPLAKVGGSYHHLSGMADVDHRATPRFARVALDEGNVATCSCGFSTSSDAAWQDHIFAGPETDQFREGHERVSVKVALEDTNTDDTMWEVELPGDSEDPASGEDAADVGDVSTPGQEVADYPQPTASLASQYEAAWSDDDVWFNEGISEGPYYPPAKPKVEPVEEEEDEIYLDDLTVDGVPFDPETPRAHASRTALTLDPDKEPDDQTPAFGWELPEDPSADPDLGQGAADVADVPTPGDALDGSYPQPSTTPANTDSVNSELDDSIDVEEEPEEEPEEEDDEEKKTAALKHWDKVRVLDMNRGEYRDGVIVSILETDPPTYAVDVSGSSGTSFAEEELITTGPEGILQRYSVRKQGFDATHHLMMPGPGGVLRYVECTPIGGIGDGEFVTCLLEDGSKVKAYGGHLSPIYANKDAARSDYEHWNEEADAVWWAEEGSQPESEPDPDEFYDEDESDEEDIGADRDSYYSNLKRVGEWYDEVGDDDKDDKDDEESDEQSDEDTDDDSDEGSGDGDDDSSDDSDDSDPVEESESAPEGEKEEESSAEDTGEDADEDDEESEPEDDDEKKEAFRATVQANLRGMR